MIKDNRMIYPPIAELTDGDAHNRYELVIAVAKGARRVTNEYLSMRASAEQMINDKETDKPILSLIDPEYREQKYVCSGKMRFRVDANFPWLTADNVPPQIIQAEYSISLAGIESWRMED